MKAIRYTRYGPSSVLQLADIPKPKPIGDEILVRVHNAALNPLDWRLMRANPFFIRFMFGYFKPKMNVMGADFAGTVEAVGPEVTRFQPGDAVWGTTFMKPHGAFAEYVPVSQETAALKPKDLSFAEASTLGVAGLTAHQSLHHYGEIKIGQDVLVMGASGGVGTFAVQMAVAAGANVTAVCSGRNADLVRSLGASRVIDYTQTEVTEEPELYDLVVYCAGHHLPKRGLKLLKPNGILAGVGFSRNCSFFLGMLIDKKPRKDTGAVLRMVTDIEKSPATLEAINNLVASGTVKPVIDRSFPLGKTAEAVTYLESLRARGKVVLDISQPPSA